MEIGTFDNDLFPGPVAANFQVPVKDDAFLISSGADENSSPGLSASDGFLNGAKIRGAFGGDGERMRRVERPFVRDNRIAGLRGAGYIVQAQLRQQLQQIGKGLRLGAGGVVHAAPLAKNSHAFIFLKAKAPQVPCRSSEQRLDEFPDVEGWGFFSR